MYSTGALDLCEHDQRNIAITGDGQNRRPPARLRRLRKLKKRAVSRQGN